MASSIYLFFAGREKLSISQCSWIWPSCRAQDPGSCRLLVLPPLWAGLTFGWSGTGWRQRAPASPLPPRVTFQSFPEGGAVFLRCPQACSAQWLCRGSQAHCLISHCRGRGLALDPPGGPSLTPGRGPSPRKAGGGAGPSVSMTCGVPSAHCSSPAGTPRCAPTRLRWLLPLQSAVFCFGPFCPSSRVRFVHVTKTYLIMEGKGVERPWAVKAASPSPGHAPCLL